MHELWEEYEGVDGQTGVRELERKWGKKWRESNKESKFYGNRKVIYDEIERLAKMHRPVNYQMAVRDLESRRETNGGSLDWLMKDIR